MHTDETPTATQDLRDAIDRMGIQRLDLLAGRFSEAEIQRLSALQRRHREAPDARDLPIAVLRLLFTRWLVEHGRLGVGDGAHFATVTWDGATPAEQWGYAHDAGAPGGRLSAEHDDRPEREPAHARQCRGWRCAMRASWARIRQTVASEEYPNRWLA